MRELPWLLNLKKRATGAYFTRGSGQLLYLRALRRD